MAVSKPRYHHWSPHISIFGLVQLGSAQLRCQYQVTIQHHTIHCCWAPHHHHHSSRDITSVSWEQGWGARMFDNHVQTTSVTNIYIWQIIVMPCGELWAEGGISWGGPRLYIFRIKCLSVYCPLITTDLGGSLCWWVFSYFLSSFQPELRLTTVRGGQNTKMFLKIIPDFYNYQ